MINTPFGQKSCNVFDEDVILVPILRAGISMLHGFQKILPTSKTGFILARRDSFAKAHINQNIIAAEGKTNHEIMNIQIKPSDPYYDEIKETFT